MTPFDPIFFKQVLVSSLTSEQKSCILSLIKQQSVTFDGTNFVFDEEDDGGCRLAASTVDDCFLEFIEQDPNGNLFSSDLKEFIRTQLEEELTK